MKCVNCPANYETDNENGYDWECRIGKENNVEYADGLLGCKLKEEQIRKKLDKQLDEEARIWRDADLWFAMRDKQKKILIDKFKISEQEAEKVLNEIAELENEFDKKVKERDKKVVAKRCDNG